MLYEANKLSAGATLVPYVKGLNTDSPRVTNIRNENPQLRNRIFLPYVPLSMLSATATFGWDLTILALSEGREIKGAFNRRADLNNIIEVR